MKKLSIITICYNEPNLEQTCESIVNQTWQDFEWIVIDGGSNEETQKIWDKYKYRIDKFISEPDNGRYNAMNKGIKLATGDYLNFLNAGDWYFHNDILKDIFKDKSYNSGVLYGYEYLANSKNDYSTPYAKIFIVPKKLDKEFLFRLSIRHQAAFIRKELFNKYGLYDENNKVASDYDKWFLFLKNNETFEFLPYIITNFNNNGISLNSASRKLALYERDEVIKKYFTTEEIEYLQQKLEKYQKRKIKYSFIENVFSLKNFSSHKIITILGIHLKIKRW